MPTDKIQPPGPGLYYDVPEADYRAWDAICQSDLKKVAVSPLDYRWSQERERATTADQLTGRVCHTSLFEPQLFDSLYAVHDKPNQRTNAGKEEWNKIREQVALVGKTVIPTTDYDYAMALRDATRAHPEAGRLLGLEGKAEVSAVWTDPETGMVCKGRFDWLPKAEPVIVDYKTALSAKPRAFRAAIWKYGYHVQAAFYTYGHRVITDPPPFDGRTFRFIVVEKASLGPYKSPLKLPRHHVAVYECDAELLEEGARIWVEALRRLRDCQELDTWPGYSDGCETLSTQNGMNGEDDDSDETGI